MPTPPKRPAARARASAPRVCLAVPRLSDTDEFLAAVRASRRLHAKWVRPPRTPARYREFVARFGARAQREPRAAAHAALLVRRRDDGALVGAFNFGDIVRGSFHSGYLGYFAFAPHAGAGYMAEGLELALRFAFRTLGLHRVEVNVQPRNLRSRALVEAAGFAREGYSRRYLRIDGRWRDHVRYALLVEDWRARRKPSR